MQRENIDKMIDEKADFICDCLGIKDRKKFIDRVRKSLYDYYCISDNSKNELLKTPLDVAKDCELMCQTDLWGKEDLRELYQHLIVMCSNME